MGKVTKNIKSFIDGVFFGLKGADDIISTKSSYGSSESVIIQEQTKDSLYNDLLRGEETQRVKEFRDEFYRTIDQASKMEVNVQTSNNFEENFDDENLELKATVRKKTPLDFVCKIEVYNPEKLHLKCIQDNIQVPEKSAFSEGGDMTSDKSVNIFRIKRDGIIPRFKIEDYSNKLVIRMIDEKTSYLDFYVSIYASQFGVTYDKDGKIKKDNTSLLISELKRLMDKKIRSSDIAEFSELSFESEKAYGVVNPSHFEFDNIKYISTNVFDGNFVITLKANNKVFGKSSKEKYHTKELEEKLKKNAARDEVSVDLLTAMRHLEEEKINE